MKNTYSVFTMICFVFMANGANAQNNKDRVNYTWKTLENLKFQAGLPDPFVKADGTRIKSKKEWPEQRRYIKAMLAHYQYGEMPPRPEKVTVRETLSEELFNGTAVRKLYELKIERNGRSIDLHFGIIKPRGDGPFPVIIKNDRDVPDPVNHDQSRVETGHLGIPRAALQEALERGYIYCAYNREDLGSDLADEYEQNRNNGVFPLYPEYDWGTIAAWAWGTQLIIDYFEKLDFVDSEKVVVTGHSRGGKAAFCAVFTMTE